MPRLSPELAKTNPNITFSDMGKGFKSYCDLISPAMENRFASCFQISHQDNIIASNNEDGWTIEGIKPPIIPCAECPIARNQSPKK